MPGDPLQAPTSRDSASTRATGPTGPRILVVEDESTVAHVVRAVLQEKGCDVDVAGSAEEGLRILEQSRPDLALVDIVLPGMNGLELLAEIKKTSPGTEVLIMTSHASLETAVRAIREGAYDYLEKPFEDLDDVWITINRALEKRNLSSRNQTLLLEQEQQNRKLTAAVMRLSSMIEAGRAMGEFDSLPALLDFFLGLVANELDVERASLMLLDEETQELQIAAHRGLEEIDVREVRVPLGRGIAGSVARSGEPFLVKDAQTDPRLESDKKPDLSDSFICAPIVLSIPIRSRTSVLGVINITNRKNGQPFTEDDLSYLAGLAGQAAVAIERTGHFEKLQYAYDSLKAAQDQLVRSERLNAVGEMAAGVAHDFNNALSVILGRAGFVLRKLKRQPLDAGAIRADLETIKKIAVQTAETIRRIQDFTRIHKDAPETPVNLNAIVRDVLEMTRPKWMGESQARGARIEVRSELNDISMISGNLSEISQLVNNLVFNAVDAMPDGGVLAFRTAEHDGHVILEITDNGFGMSEETCKRLFEPFFTTKKAGQGLGMSIVYGIVKRHRGEITVDSKRGEGTSFRIKLPKHRAASETTQSEAKSPDADAPMIRVLLVDDDETVLETYEQALTEEGHYVVAVSTGAQALSEFGPDKFDLVITDHAATDLSGLDLAKQLREIDSGAPVVLLSGGCLEHDDEAIEEAGISQVIAKPCSIDDLLDAVQRTTGSDGTSRR